METLTTTDTADTLTRKRQTLRETAELSLKAIVSRLNNEFIFEKPNGGLEILTGPDSAKTFRGNFYLRLAEALANLIYLHNAAQPVRGEIILYLNVYDALDESIELPSYLVKLANRLRDLIS